jgi:hypothetical protein
MQQSIFGVPDGHGSVMRWSVRIQVRRDRLRSKLEAMAAQWDDQANRGAVSRTMPDTGLLGNGDGDVTSGGRVGAKTFYLSKGDFCAS